MTDKDTVTKAKPFIRGVLAFLLYWRDPIVFNIEGAYKQADEFIARLLKDL